MHIGVGPTREAADERTTWDGEYQKFTPPGKEDKMTFDAAELVALLSDCQNRISASAAQVRDEKLLMCRAFYALLLSKIDPMCGEEFVAFQYV